MTWRLHRAQDGHAVCDTYHESIEPSYFWNTETLEVRCKGCRTGNTRKREKRKRGVCASCMKSHPLLDGDFLGCHYITVLGRSGYSRALCPGAYQRPA